MFYVVAFVCLIKTSSIKIIICMKCALSFRIIFSSSMLLSTVSTVWLYGPLENDENCVATWKNEQLWLKKKTIFPISFESSNRFDSYHTSSIKWITLNWWNISSYIFLLIAVGNITIWSGCRKFGPKIKSNKMIASLTFGACI